jgi:L-asparagine transporter-like permease
LRRRTNAGIETVYGQTAIFLAIYAPQKALLLLYGTAVAGMFFVWLVVLATHLRFRRAPAVERVAQLRLQLPLHPLPTLFGLASLLAIAGSTFFVRGLEYTVPTFAVFLGAIRLAYWFQLRATNRDREQWSRIESNDGISGYRPSCFLPRAQ